MKVYRKPTAVRFVRHEAMKMPKDESVLVLLRPSGSCIGVYASGTGRKASARVATQTRRMVRDLLPQLFPTARRRRTSRRATAVRPRKRRTSRVPQKKLRRRAR